MPKDTNAQGDIFGGWIMAQVDIAGAVIASSFAESKVVTVAVKEFVFKKPVFVGDLISCYAKVVKVGTTSITVHVEVCAQRFSQRGECIPVTEATVVYVSIDDEGQPVKISNEKT
ncbi:MAG: acyl-CoA thioesterase [Nitrospinota bacterium]